MQDREKGSAAMATLLLALIDETVEPEGPRGCHQRRGISPPLPSTGQLVTRYGERPGVVCGPQSFHTGLDFYAPRGTPVFAVRPGAVEHVLDDDALEPGFIGYGNSVVISHADEDVWTFYAHLEETLVLPGMRVAAGQAIGRIGNTTNGRLRDMPVRLHFEVRVRGRQRQRPFPGPYRVNSRDPEAWLRSRGVCYDRRGELVLRRSVDPSFEPASRRRAIEWSAEPLTPLPDRAD